MPVDVPAGSNITGLVPYSVPDFLTENVEIVVGIPQFKGASGADPEADVYPGVDSSTGDLKFTRDLEAGETILMTVGAGNTTSRFTAQYEPLTQHLEIFVWAERGGSRVATAYQAGVVLKLDGAVIRTYGPSTTHDADGVFKFETTPITLVKGRTYFAVVTMLLEPGGSQVPVNQTMINF
jgi:hypothetical protein